MIPVMLLMLAGGIGLAQAVSDPKAVTLQWLRLGGLIAVTLLAVAVAAIYPQRAEIDFPSIALIIAAVAVPSVVQLMATQLAARTVQRVAAGVFFLACAGVVTWWAFGLLKMKYAMDQAGIGRPPELPGAGDGAILFICVAASAGLLGGFLMTMLLGHAYLTAGNEMTQAPFRRLVIMLGILLLLRAAASVIFGLMPHLRSMGDVESAAGKLWPLMMIITRYAVGLLVTGIFTWMTYDCVKRRANQSATGIMYVATLMVIVGEWTALTLWERTWLAF